MADSLEILITEHDIQARVRELAAEIDRVFAGKHLTIVIISNGAVLFGADLVRQISIPLHLDTISVSSYVGTRSSLQVNILSALRLDITGRSVLIVDDIVDTGLTLNALIDEFGTMEPDEIRTCVLLDKAVTRQRDIVPDFTGFEIADRFVVGYGLDYHENYRSLPYIAVLTPHDHQDD